ncbi:MAG: metal ABC transporter solute-binding protein, Zn/Mn family [Nitrososphaeraceae archaeon]
MQKISNVLIGLLLLTILLVSDSSIASSTNTNTNTTSNDSSTFAGTSKVSTPKLKVVASFFPVYEFVRKVGGDKVDVSVLVPLGAEPHDFDPTIQQIQDVESAAILVYNGVGMEAIWINKVNPKLAVDTSKGLNLLASRDPEIHAPADPHIWLDPILAIHQVENIRDGLSKVDPNNSVYYDQNAQKFIGQLKSLDASIKYNLSCSNCAKRDFIAFHNAFSYFAKQYGLNQHSIKGLTPEGEILPQRLVEVVQLAKHLGINIIYSEDLINPRSSQAIADEIPNGKVMVLSPIEGINKQEQQQGIGYLEKMYQDLSALKEGLRCKK